LRERGEMIIKEILMGLFPHEKSDRIPHMGLYGRAAGPAGSAAALLARVRRRLAQQAEDAFAGPAAVPKHPSLQVGTSAARPVGKRRCSPGPEPARAQGMQVSSKTPRLADSSRARRRRVRRRRRCGRATHPGHDPRPAGRSARPKARPPVGAFDGLKVWRLDDLLGLLILSDRQDGPPRAGQLCMGTPVVLDLFRRRPFLTGSLNRRPDRGACPDCWKRAVFVLA
jgi:hypothetical protein